MMKGTLPVAALKLLNHVRAVPRRSESAASSVCEAAARRSCSKVPLCTSVASATNLLGSVADSGAPSPDSSKSRRALCVGDSAGLFEALRPGVALPAPPGCTGGVLGAGASSCRETLLGRPVDGREGGEWGMGGGKHTPCTRKRGMGPLVFTHDCYRRSSAETMAAHSCGTYYPEPAGDLAAGVWLLAGTNLVEVYCGYTLSC